MVPPMILIARRRIVAGACAAQKQKPNAEEKDRMRSEKLKEKRDALAVKPGCKNTCKRETKCSELFSENHRKQINE